jgi:large subunit ribosomal protein L10
MARVAKSKLMKVQKLTEAILSKKVVGIVGIEGIKSSQLQQMRRALRNKALLLVAKNRLLAKALTDAGKTRTGLENLIADISGQAGLILSDESSFKLCKLMDATKTPAPAKGGETAPADIVVKKGDTSFKPGPIVGDLQKVGIPAGIESGKVVIKKDVTVVKKGDRISREVAQVLTMLEIYPFTAGLDLKAAFEDGLKYERKVLEIDDTKYKADIQNAVKNAYNLAIRIAYPMKDTISVLLQIGHTNAVKTALAAHIPTKTTINYLIRSAYLQMIAVASRTLNALDDDLKKLISASETCVSTTMESEQKQEQEKEEKKEEKKVTPEDAASGLSSLFDT